MAALGSRPWTDPEVALVRAMADQNETADTMSTALHERLGSQRTRNSIISLCNRHAIKLLGKGGRPHTRERTPRRDREREARKQGPGRPLTYPRPPIHERRQPPTHAEMVPTPFLEARSGSENGQCRFPLWGDGPTPIAEKLVCGAPGFPWCEYHRNVVGA